MNVTRAVKVQVQVSDDGMPADVKAQGNDGFGRDCFPADFVIDGGLVKRL